MDGPFYNGPGYTAIHTLQEGPEAVAAMLTYVDVYGNPAEATLPTKATKLAALLGAVSNINDEHTAPTFAYTPRVRREWRTLSTAMKRKVAAAYWVMRTVNSSTGRELYGPNFINYDEFVLKHTCVANDPKCDQGHFGPHFVTTHRTFVLWAERSLLAIDPTIGAAPYWDATKDAVASNPEVADGEYRDEPMLYIYGSEYFGDYAPENEFYAVRNGMFANWTVSNIDDPAVAQFFGSTGSFASESQCLAQSFFQPPNCVAGDETSPRYIRFHRDNCSPTFTRKPSAQTGGVGILGTTEMVYGQADFDACTSAANCPTFLAWQDCIEGTVVHRVTHHAALRCHRPATLQSHPRGCPTGPRAALEAEVAALEKLMPLHSAPGNLVPAHDDSHQHGAHTARCVRCGRDATLY